jgi:hypothetical protein
MSEVAQSRIHRIKQALAQENFYLHPTPNPDPVYAAVKPPPIAEESHISVLNCKYLAKATAPHSLESLSKLLNKQLEQLSIKDPI